MSEGTVWFTDVHDFRSVAEQETYGMDLKRGLWAQELEGAELGKRLLDWLWFLGTGSDEKLPWAQCRSPMEAVKLVEGLTTVPVRLQ